MSRSLRLVPVVALSAVAIVLAGCGSSSNSGTVPSLGANTDTQRGAPSGTLSEWRAAVACVRRHGMPGMPDPVVGANGQISVPGYASTADLTPAAQSACAAQIRAISSSASTHQIESASDIEALLRVAVCMRKHGYPTWPDPNERGEFHVKSADAGTPAKMHKAVTACNSLFPASGWHLTVTPSGQ
jgi:hypothetical protein